jgi:CTP synthase
MRLGLQTCVLRPGSLAHRAYGADEVLERHRHRYEFNNGYRMHMEDTGLIPTGTSPDGSLVEIIEVPDHPWFLAVQFHPEFRSKPTKAHPLFRDFIAAALARREGGRAEVGAGA